MKYPKINTIWKRDETTGAIIEGDFSKKEFDNIHNWHITEKIDGTNIQIQFENKIENPLIKFGGRTDDAQIPVHLFDYLKNTFTVDKLKSILVTPDVQCVRLFGEGYGAKIQKGRGLYRKDVGFILFDVWIDGWWLERDAVFDIAIKLGIRPVPDLGITDIHSAIEFVKRKPQSMIAVEEKVIEGIVARSSPLMLFRDGTPIMWKLKVRDFK